VKLSSLCIPETTPLKETLAVIEKTGYGILFVVTNKKFIGLVTDSDIRRSLLSGKNLSCQISKVMNTKPIILHEPWTKLQILNIIKKPEIKDLFLTKNIFVIPVLNSKDELIDFVLTSVNGYEWKFSDENKKVIPIKRVLVVGGAGYLGSVLCVRLIQKGYLVKVLDNLTYGGSGLSYLKRHPSFEFIQGDMRDIHTVVKAVEDVDAVIHLAAIVGDKACDLNPKETIETNYFATKLLAEICKYSQINRFIFASTCSVYGASSSKRIREDSPTNPVSLYAEMKLRSEDAVLSMKDGCFSPVVFRMATLFGVSDRMRFDLVVNLLTIKAIYEKQINIFGGDQWRPFLHVKDAADAYIKCLESPLDKVSGQIFNIGSDAFNYKINQIGDLIKIIIPETNVITEKKSIDKRDYNVCFEKSEKILDINPVINVQNGIYEIKTEVERFKDYKDKKYSNSDYLEGMY
jgi:nucleoside-diphosphate-sugar epimerase